MGIVKAFFDVDGVVCDLPSALEQIISEHFNTIFTVSDMKTPDFLSNFDGDIKEAWKVYNDFTLNGGLLRTDPLQDSLYVFDLLKQHPDFNKLHIEFVTRRTTDDRAPVTNSQKKQIRLATIRWLSINNYPYKAVKFIKDKEKYARDTGCTIFVEDTPESAEKIAQEVRHSFLIDRPWNQQFKCKDSSRAGWKEVYDTIIKELENANL